MNYVYILMQKEHGQIKMIDVSTDMGRQCATELCTKGYKDIGTLESELPASELLSGFCNYI